MIDEKNSKDKIVSRQSIQQSLLHTLQQCIDDNVLQNKNNKEKAKSTVKFTVDRLVKKTAKNFNMNYRMAKERAKVDEMQFLLDRILRMMRPKFSTENYKDIIIGLQSASYYEKLDFIIEMEKKYDKHRTTARPVPRSS